jgi:hypothetical protein
VQAVQAPCTNSAYLMQGFSNTELTGLCDMQAALHAARYSVHPLTSLPAPPPTFQGCCCYCYCCCCWERPQGLLLLLGLPQL